LRPVCLPWVVVYKYYHTYYTHTHTHIILYIRKSDSLYIHIIICTHNIICILTTYIHECKRLDKPVRVYVIYIIIIYLCAPVCESVSGARAVADDGRIPEYGGVRRWRDDAATRSLEPITGRGRLRACTSIR